MSFVSCEMDYREESRFTQTAREWREWWKVGMSTLSDGPLQIYMALRKFQLYQPHDEDRDALVAEWYPQRIDATNYWLLELRYSTDVDVALNPLQIPAVVTMDTQIREVPTVFDANGNPLLNTAGMLMTDPAAVRKLVDQVINVSKNVPLNLPDWAFTHPGRVNEDNVTIRGRPFAAGTLFFAGRQIGQENNVPGLTETVSTLRGTPYTTIDFELWYREQGWVELYPNRGWFQVVFKDPKKIPKGVTEVQGQKPLTAQQLRAQWRKLPDYTLQRAMIGPLGDWPPEPPFLDAFGRAIQNPTFDDVLLIQYDGYLKATFSGLPGVT